MNDLRRLSIAILLGLMALARTAYADDPLAITRRLPEHQATNVCADMQLKLTFNRPPTLGRAGKIRIYNAADDQLVDELDVGIASDQQSYNIGGNVLHAWPVIVDDKTATIYPHNNKLAYGKTYYVQIDAGVFGDGTGPFAGYSGKADWTFSTKAAAPRADSQRVVVAADGSGDFATVQGAVDWVPQDNATPRTIFLRKGIYREIVSFTAKNNITFLGEDRDATVVCYSNNNTFQPNLANPQAPFSGSSYRRGVFMGFNSSGVALANFTVRNTTPKGGSQAEAVIFKEWRGQAGPNNSQTILTHMSLYSYQDTLQITGKGYIADTYIEGDTDFMWGDGPCYFGNCHLRTLTNGTSMTQTRNPATHRGFVFVDCTFDGAPGVTTASLGNGSGASEIALINCRLGTMLRPEGWNSRGAANLEFNTTTLDGKPYDMSRWPAWVKHLDKEKDAETIANYRNPTWVLDGWTPAPPTLDSAAPR
jgi:pectin methylesterase-like acyl-CoA thioesterase